MQKQTAATFKAVTTTPESAVDTSHHTDWVCNGRAVYNPNNGKLALLDSLSWLDCSCTTSRVHPRVHNDIVPFVLETIAKLQSTTDHERAASQYTAYPSVSTHGAVSYRIQCSPNFAVPLPSQLTIQTPDETHAVALTYVSGNPTCDASLVLQYSSQIEWTHQDKEYIMRVAHSPDNVTATEANAVTDQQTTCANLQKGILHDTSGRRSAVYSPAAVTSEDIPCYVESYSPTSASRAVRRRLSRLLNKCILLSRPN